MKNKYLSSKQRTEVTDVFEKFRKCTEKNVMKINLKIVTLLMLRG